MAARGARTAVSNAGGWVSEQPIGTSLRHSAGAERKWVYRRSKRGIEYRWAEGRYERPPALAAELVRRPVAVIVASAPPAALAAPAYC